MITVITTTHERPDLLYRCIKAVQRQTLQNYEHIIVGDRCTHARQVVTFVNDFRIKYYDTPPNRPDNVGGVGKNIGIQHAHYDAICYCDDDNLLLPNALQDFINNLGDLDYACGKVYSTKHLPVGNGSTLSILEKPFMYIGAYTTTNDDMLCYVHTKKIINNIGGWYYKANIGTNEDGNLIRRLRAYSQKCCNFDKYVGIYHDRSACQTLDVEYDYLVSKLEGNNIFVYPELTTNI
jgi:glycosyltransferase involved in cell wall biosynthesis